MRMVLAWVTFGLILLSTVAGVTYLLWQRRQPADKPPPGGIPEQEWIAKLAVLDPTQAAETLDALVALRAEGVPLLLQARKNTDLRIHRRAVAGLIRLGTLSAPGLVEALPLGGSRAEVALLRLGSDAVPALEKGLIASNPGPPARVLGLLGDKARSAVPSLTALLQNQEVPLDARCAVATALGEIGPQGIPGDSLLSTLISALASPEDKVRTCAARALARIGPAARSAMADLTRLSRDPNPEIAAVACTALGQLGAPGAAGPLIFRLRLGDASSRAAALALARLGETSRPALASLISTLKTPKEPGQLARAVLERLGSLVLSDLEEALGDSDPLIRQAAAEVLGLMGPRASTAAPALLRRLEDPSPQVLLQAALALAYIDRSKAEKFVPRLRQLLHDSNHQIADSAAFALAECDQAGLCIPDLLADLKSSENPRLRRAIHTLGRFGPAGQSAIKDLKKLLSHPELRLQAALALARIDPTLESELLPYLSDDLDSPKETRRQAALQCLAAMPIHPAGLLPSLRPLLGKPLLAREVLPLLERLDLTDLKSLSSDLKSLLSSTDPSLRAYAQRLLSRIELPLPSPPSADRLIELLGSPEVETRREAVQAAPRVPPEQQHRLTPHLAECLLDPDEEVRLGAALALGELGQTQGLREALADGSPAVRLAVLESLIRLGKAENLSEPLLHLARRATPAERPQVLALLLKFDAARARELLPEIELDLRSDDITDRTQAAVWLVRLDDSQLNTSLPFLQGVLAGWNARARSAAALALGELGEKARPALPALIRAGQRDEDPQVRLAAHQALKKIQP